MCKIENVLSYELFRQNLKTKTKQNKFLFIFTVPSPYPNHPINSQPNRNHDQIIHQTISQHLTTLPDIIISHPINHNQAVYVQSDAGKRATVAMVPNYMLYNGQNNNNHDNNQNNNNNNHNIGTNGEGIFMTVSTDQYPIEQSSLDEDLRERFEHFLDQWIKAFLYLSRK